MTASDRETGPVDEPLDTAIRLVTPERITFRYPLAGPARRGLAFLLDLLVLLVLMIAGLILSLALSLGSGAGFGLFLAFLFFLSMGYGAFCESAFNGRTIGKMALQIRVVGDQGTPITATQAILRNLLLTFDGLPTAYLPALACMALTRRFQRLGDLAAGTMVMIESRPYRASLVAIDPAPLRPILSALPPRLDAGAEMAQALSDYARSRHRFGPARREEMARPLADPLRSRHDLPADALADAILCAAYHRVFRGD